MQMIASKTEEAATQTDSEFQEQLDFYKMHLERICKLYSHPLPVFRADAKSPRSSAKKIKKNKENKPVTPYKSPLQVYT